ncbi:Adenylylsulfate kinase [Petrocella atlantisensis]|uniref:Adenylylsulfate kinase n=1 Tax=Petrocella atlantisensis TaxID=2173034 RepID=A0A3P7PSH9_9FIRM|nr:adenylylsulfate kinase [Petrocella atlantisensis]VDN46181.1 Adenylylsulfate kinase [Petrocella atlantisensis]
MEKKEDKKMDTFQWVAPQLVDYDNIKKGDMPGDVIQIQTGHIMKAEAIFPKLYQMVKDIQEIRPKDKVVISVHGGSGVGKSEIGALLAYYFNDVGIGSYILSGDNYPHRIPKHNDEERLRIFREMGLKGLVAQGAYNRERGDKLRELQALNQDFDPDQIQELPWLFIYQQEGRKGLEDYLGTSAEIDFDEINHIIAEFKHDKESILLKRMGREETDLWYEKVDFSNIKVVIIEWTHGNNDALIGVDIPILLNSTPSETLEHRKLRNRDGGTDSPFTTMVLDIEQKLLFSQASGAKIIVLKDGEIVGFEQYRQIMLQEGL